MSKNKVLKYYDINNILQYNATYNVVIGERSNGKTYASLKYGLEQYIKKQRQLAIIRRWDVDLKAKNASVMFDALVSNNVIKQLTNDTWTDVYYYSKRWYLCRYDEDGNRTIADEPFAYAFALSMSEHDKSTSYPKIGTIGFDEFLTRGAYLPDEFVLFMNLISTIVRQRNNVQIFMLANTVNKYCPYFAEMGLNHVKTQKQGTIDIYTYGNSELTVALEYCGNISETGKPSDKYFAFDNPKLQMITGGAWELDIYPHLTVEMKYKPKDIVFKYFIKFDDNILQCDVVMLPNMCFTYIHQKTTGIKSIDTDLTFSPEYNPRYNWRRNILKPIDKIGKRVIFFYQHDNVYYQNNEIGEIVRNYMNWCKTY